MLKDAQEEVRGRRRRAWKAASDKAASGAQRKVVGRKVPCREREGGEGDNGLTYQEETTSTGGISPSCRAVGRRRGQEQGCRTPERRKGGAGKAKAGMVKGRAGSSSACPTPWETPCRSRTSRARASPPPPLESGGARTSLRRFPTRRLSERPGSIMRASVKMVRPSWLQHSGRT